MTNLTPEEKAILERLENAASSEALRYEFIFNAPDDIRQLLQTISTERARAEKLADHLLIRDSAIVRRDELIEKVYQMIKAGRYHGVIEKIIMEFKNDQ